MLCCKAGVEGRLAYVFNPTILFVYGGEDSVVSGCVEFVLLKQGVLFWASVGRFREGKNCFVVTCL